MTEVLVVIVTYNAMHWIDRCLDSVRKSSVKADVFVVDNGSTDGTVEHIEEFFPETIIRESGENLGFGKANNIGLRYALEKGYGHVYLLNQDAWLENDTLAVMLEAWPKNFGILSPVQKDANGKLDKNFKKFCAGYFNGLNEVETVPFVMAAHWLLNRETIETVGGFSPAFKHYGEDNNYIDRLHYHGLKVGVVTTASAVHDRAGRKETREKKMQHKCIIPLVKLSDPNASAFWRALVEPLELLGMTVKNFSLIPAKYIPTLIKRYKELFDLRKASMKKGAFL